MKKLLLALCIILLCSCQKKAQEKEDESDTIEIELSEITRIEEEEEEEKPELKAPDNYKECLQEEQDEFVPEGYCQRGKLEGDLNGDGLSDYILMVQATEEDGWQYNQWETEVVNKNRQGVVIVLNSENGYQVHTKNLTFLDSDNEDGGVYYSPEMDMRITEKGLIDISFAHGRYGYWNYLFRYQDDKFELIGYEGHSNRGPVPCYIYSYNFSTMRKKVSENILADEVTKDGDYDEKWVATWSDIDMEERINLANIADLSDVMANID